MDETINLVRKAKLEIERAKTENSTVNQPAFNSLYEKYRPLIASMSTSFYTTCDKLELSVEDFWQEASLAFTVAVEKYDEAKNREFGAYAKICIRNRLTSYYRKLNSKRKVKSREENDADYSFLDALSNETRTRIRSAAKAKLSRLEFEIFELCCQRLKTKDIAPRLGKSAKSVNNAIYRMRKKLDKIRDELK